MTFATKRDIVNMRELVLQEIMSLTKEEQAELLAYCKARKEKRYGVDKRTDRSSD